MGGQLHQLVARVERTTGPGLLHPATALAERTGALPTGIAPVDAMTAFGGIPRGRLTELVGGPSSGKTLLAHQLLAETTRDGTAVYLDPPCAFCPLAAAAAGVALPHLVVARPRTAAEALETAATFVRSGGVDLVLWDDAARQFAPRVVERLALAAARSGVALVFVSTSAPTQHLGSTPLDFALALQLQITRTTWLFGHPDRLDAPALHGWHLQVAVLKAKAAVQTAEVAVAITAPPPGTVGTGAWAGIPHWPTTATGGRLHATDIRSTAPAGWPHPPLSISADAPRGLRRVAPLALAGHRAAAARATGTAGGGA